MGFTFQNDVIWERRERSRKRKIPGQEERCIVTGSSLLMDDGDMLSACDREQPHNVNLAESGVVGLASGRAFGPGPRDRAD